MSAHEQRDHAASWAQRLRARERGDLPISREFGSTLGLIGGFALLTLFAEACWNGLAVVAADQWRWTGAQAFLPFEMLGHAAAAIGQPLCLLAGAFFSLAFGVGWIQTGCGFFWNRLQFDVGRLGPVRNLRQANSLGHWVSSLLGLLRWLTLWAVVLGFIWSARDAILAVGAMNQKQWLPAAATVVYSIAIKSIAVLALLGLADYAVQWWWYERRIAMSPDALRRELQASQIDPYVSQRRHSLGRNFVQSGIIRSVRASDVLLTDETGAVIGLALSDCADDLPQVVLRAGAAHAEATKHIAARFGIPVQNHSVASSLFARCRVENSVPQDLMGIVRALDLRRRPLP